MKYSNIFFKKRKKIFLYDVVKNLKIKNKKNYKKVLINDIQNLSEANNNDISFFHSAKYKDLLKVTKSNLIITTSKLSYHLPKTKNPLIVDNVLLAVAKVTEYIYPDSINDEYEKKGGNLKDLKTLVEDLGLYIPSVIGLWNCMDASEESFNGRLDEHRNRLRMVSAIGSEKVQVIPNMKLKDSFDLNVASWCYRQILELSINDYGMKGAGIVFLNFFAPLSTITDATQVAFGADHKKAQIIPDTFHMFLGNSKLENFNHLQGDFITIFQFSDCPAGVKPHGRHDDKIRVLPGDGVLPLVETLQTLKRIQYKGPISLELYNLEYRAREPKAFLAEALRKTVQVTRKGSHS